MKIFENFKFVNFLRFRFQTLRFIQINSFDYSEATSINDFPKTLIFTKKTRT